MTKKSIKTLCPFKGTSFIVIILHRVIFGLTLGQGLGKPIKEEKNKNGQSRNRNSDTSEISRGVCSVDPSDEENKDIIKNAKAKV